MAENEQPTQTQSSLASTFPGPPPFWKDFTPENIARVEELKKAHADATGQQLKPASRLPNVPDDLVNLLPPAEPTDGQWRVFGDLYKLQDELPSLQDQGIDVLLPKDGSGDDKALQLKRMAKSLLLNFLELSDAMTVDLSRSEAKINDIRTLFINMHHTINEWRPHQAREALIAMAQNRIDRTRNETKALREVTENARRTLEGLASLEMPAAAAGSAAGDGDEGVLLGEGRRGGPAVADRQREMWEALDDVAFA